MDKSSKILIIDDQQSARDVLRGLLAGGSYHLAFAASGQEALDKAAEFIPDLILLDVMMPGMDGFEVCEHVRADADLAEVPIIMVTTLDDRASRVRGLEAGADDFVSKPFDTLELRTRVQTITRLNRYRRLLAERSSRQKAEAQAEQGKREQTLLNYVINASTSITNVDEALNVACEALSFVFRLPQAVAMLLDKRSQTLVQKTEYHILWGALGTKVDADQQTILEQNVLFAQPLLDYLSEHKAPLSISASQSDSQLASTYHRMTQYGFGALLLVPILIRNQVVGVIELKGIESRKFSTQEFTLAQSITTAVSHAIINIRLYQELQRHAERLETAVSKRTQELQVERDRTRAILEAIGDAVIVTDIEGTIQYINPAAVELTGYSEVEAKGQNWRLWQSRIDRQEDQVEQENNEGTDEVLYEAILDRIRQGQIWQGEVNNKRKDGTSFEAMITASPLFSPDKPDQPVGFVSVQSDITLLREAERLRFLRQEEEKQQDLNRLRHTFLSTVNHEMRSPLSLITQSLQMLEDTQFGDLNDRQLDMLTVIQRQFQTLEQMIGGLIRVAAFLSKKEPVRPVLARLDPVLDNVVPLAEFKARTKEITIETTIDSNLPAFPLDVKQMEEAITQLVDNAVKFNRPKGKVKIAVWTDEIWVNIAISDTGTGIDSYLMTRIWDIFEQGVDPLQRAQEGLGLGLVLARYIVEAHQGKIEVETVSEQGSTFTIKLPKTRPSKKGTHPLQPDQV